VGPVIAALLSVFPIAAAALALRIARPLPAGERAGLAAATLGFAAIALLSPALPIHDQWTHYAHLRAALADPARLLDPWDRPGFTLLYAGPAALGLTAARTTSAVVAALALAATLRAAHALGLGRPWLAGVFLVSQYDFFGQASSTMTELPFAAALAVAVWGWAERRPWLVAAGLGWCGITRPEGILFAALGAAALLVRHRRAAPAALTLVPLALWGAAGALAFRNLFWWSSGNPYDGMVGPRLDPSQLLHSYFYEALRLGQPPVLIVLVAAGAAIALAGPARRLRFLLAPLGIAFLVLTFVRIGPTDAWRESRYLVAVAPALALLAAAGLEAALAAFPRWAPPALLFLAAAGSARALVWHWRVALAGLAPWGALLTYAVLLAVAALLLASRNRLSPRLALALLLLLPLSCAPPGAFGKHRPESLTPARRDDPIWKRALFPGGTARRPPDPRGELASADPAPAAATAPARGAAVRGPGTPAARGRSRGARARCRRARRGRTPGRTRGAPRRGRGRCSARRGAP
jgi:hypothetical protein